ncbi:uncharacterized protein CC84DRAFT_1171921 [Paraphaeosphaeria sporulosa]|uniref:Uncharacterized protein n=1 Tax=Paraphaeosphaeria sporulosa TaxID=1460663 RepID=A0A177CPU1_9PLEO|nr:uncharacterized protein CC84DRAFT_1171921 [Paraphaeosphaeria sporulosa]OAG09326.1 hypothetical protein CC84DRAFT_1171921 [Paraphaeosphaeria sporulosa]
MIVLAPYTLEDYTNASQYCSSYTTEDPSSHLGITLGAAPLSGDLELPQWVSRALGQETNQFPGISIVLVAVNEASHHGPVLLPRSLHEAALCVRCVSLGCPSRRLYGIGSQTYLVDVAIAFVESQEAILALAVLPAIENASKVIFPPARWFVPSLLKSSILPKHTKRKYFGLSGGSYDEIRGGARNDVLCREESGERHKTYFGRVAVDQLPSRRRKQSVYLTI